VKSGDFTIVEFLRDKLDNDRDHKWGVSQYFHAKFLPGKDLRPRRNELLAAELETLKAEWSARLESGVYR
jgi:hypothetical protein